MNRPHISARQVIASAVVLCSVVVSLGVADRVAAVGTPPATATATVIGSGTVQVTWTEPATAIGYLVVPVVSVSGTPTEVADRAVSKAAGQTAHVFEDLANGTSYTFRVRAVFAAGVSEPRTTNAVIPVGPPGQPVLDIVPSDGELVVSWSPVASNGSPVSYFVELTKSGVSIADTSTSGLSATFTDLENEVLHRVRVTAINAVGSTESDLVSATPTTGIVPPSGLEATPDLEAVMLEWTPPAQTGGEDLDVYVAEITSPVSAQDSVEIDGAEVSYLWEGLDSDTSYTFRMKSVNVAGDESAWSVEVSATTTTEDDPDGPGGDTGGDDTGGGDTGGDDGSTAPSDRLGGGDRFQTATLISQRFFSPGVPVVYLATGGGFADALAGGPATKGDGPILLVRKDGIPSSTATELDRLNPDRIVVLGGEAVIDDSVLVAARAFTSGSVTRIGGDDRYETAAKLSAAAFSPGVAVAYLATGEGFADALAAGSAAVDRGPVLLVRKDGIPSRTATELDRLNPGRIVVLGGEAVIDDSVLVAARAFTSGAVTRIGGIDRYETAAKVSAASFSPGVTLVFLATGLDFADALAAAPVGAPVLLARKDCVPRSVLKEITRLEPLFITVLGGTGALSASVRSLTPCS